jgi:NitT/TauT family transport system permease protein
VRAGRSGRRRWLRDYGGPALTIAGLVLAWEVGVAAARVPIWLLPPPTAIVAALWAWRGQAPRHTWATLYEVLGGFVLAIAIGLPLAVAIVYSPFVRRVTYPVLLVFQSIPKVALAPLLLPLPRLHPRPTSPWRRSSPSSPSWSTR